MPGEKYVSTHSNSPNTTYEAFSNSLLRQAAKAGGLSYEDISGDYSKTSFSASRLALALPYRITLRRREILKRVYDAIFSCFVEEYLERELIKLPAGAPQFWEAKAAYLRCSWSGPGAVTADPKKEVEANTMALENHQTTLTDILAEKGVDLEDFIETRKHEVELLKAAGLIGLPMEPGAVTTMVRDQAQVTPEDEEHEDAPHDKKGDDQ